MASVAGATNVASVAGDSTKPTCEPRGTVAGEVVEKRAARGTVSTGGRHAQVCHRLTVGGGSFPA